MRLAPLNPLAPPVQVCLKSVWRVGLVSRRPAPGRAKHNQGTEERPGGILAKMAAADVSLVLLLLLGVGLSDCIRRAVWAAVVDNAPFEFKKRTERFQANKL